jgi:hypothetical protein
MKSIDLMCRTMLAELDQRSFGAAWTAEFPSTGVSPQRTSRGENTGTSTFQTVMVARNADVSVRPMTRFYLSA